ncbi:sensor histidine kinase [Plantibacter cousiniae (nom. nud.)]|nr:histidine kinase [Plantibacter cousiniae]
MTARKPSSDRDRAATEAALMLPRPPGVVRRWWSRHPWTADSLIAAGYLLVALSVSTVEWFDVDLAAQPGRIALAVAIVSITTLAVLLRRRRPLAMTVLVIAVGLVSVAQTVGVDAFAVPILLYSVAVYRTVALGWQAFATAAVVAVLAPFLPWAAPHEPGEPQQTIISVVLFALFGLLIGINVGNRKRYVEALVDRAAQLARERDQQAQLAAVAERTRIAREMHDIVSHSLTVIVALSEGALATKDPTASRSAMTAVTDAARGSLVDMRRMLGVLRETGSAPLAPQPDAASIPALVETFRGLGLPVALTVSGPSTDDPSILLAVHRITQEALTNALRYSERPKRVDVVITTDDEHLELIVENDGSIPDAPSLGAGQGLLGLRERVAFQGGRVTAGAVGDRLWRVHAVLPLEPRPTRTSPPTTEPRGTTP